MSGHGTRGGDIEIATAPVRVDPEASTGLAPSGDPAPMGCAAVGVPVAASVAVHWRSNVIGLR